MPAGFYIDSESVSYGSSAAPSRHCSTILDYVCNALESSHPRRVANIGACGFGLWRIPNILRAVALRYSVCWLCYLGVKDELGCCRSACRNHRNYRRSGFIDLRSHTNPTKHETRCGQYVSIGVGNRVRYNYADGRTSTLGSPAG